ncbi:MFS transporter [Amnibacterium endophyticum]|uniref:MFS transporter n=1 Tax=Amnibacterium endophyticum TaxID=2109337 RepID=A0ABW4LGX1_9MICO
MSGTAGAFGAAFRFTTIGVFSLGFLIAFEALAVTTAMPLVARDLDGRALYALAFSAFSATSVLGTVVAGAWADRSGPGRPLLVGAGLFAAGLVLAASAWSMPVLVTARGVQGLGAGAVGTALYVLVARIYPERLHPRVFALLAAAWVLPSLVGPFAAGAVATWLTWHWVFAGILPLVGAAVALLLPVLRAQPMPGTGAALPRARIGWAAVAAAAVLVLQPVLAVPGAGPVLAAGAVVVAVVALRPLLPAGALRAARGLPALVVARGLFSAGFACADAYLPYSLIELRGIPATAAGGIVTVGALSWATGSELQSRLAGRLSDRRCITIGAGAFLTGLIAVGAVELTGAPVPLLVVAWLTTGLGIGLAFPRISTALLSQSAEAERGRNSAALQIGDGFGVAIALTGVGVAAALAPGSSFPAAFGLAAALGVLAVLVAPRVAAPLRR